MKAVIQKKYGGPETLFLEEVPKPVIKDKEVLIKVKAANVASGDRRINTFDVPFALKPIFGLIFGFKKPRKQIRGISAAGIIEAVGKEVSNYQVGDKVYFINSMNAGCLAEYIALPEKAVMVKIPDNLNYHDAAPLAFGALSAFHFINKFTIKPGFKVLIYGASGSVGSYGLQFAKYYGGEVTAISSKKNHDKMIALGASHVIDYKIVDFWKESKKYDVIFDAVGLLNKKDCKSVLNQNGTFLSVKSMTKEDISRLLTINEIIEEGKLITLIDTIFPFEKYREAHALTYTGHKVGNVVIKID